jgi:hypothetical protein
MYLVAQRIKFLKARATKICFRVVNLVCFPLANRFGIYDHFTKSSVKEKGKKQKKENQ